MDRVRTKLWTCWNAELAGGLGELSPPPPTSLKHLHKVISNRFCVGASRLWVHTRSWNYNFWPSTTFLKLVRASRRQSCHFSAEERSMRVRENRRSVAERRAHVLN